ncbi:hypothetical protein SAMN05444397_10587 [Flavobacterium aquidurense]|nr:hypothetical protein SAMN05444397_10587 [Flavobacterium aquidurense]
MILKVHLTNLQVTQSFKMNLYHLYGKKLSIL